MGLYQNNSGVLTPIAGRGRAEYGASTYREKTISFTVNALSYAKLTVTFDEPMPDANYIIAYPEISTFYSSLSFQILNTASEPITANGFTALVTNTYNGQLSTTVKFKVFKLYTDVEYDNLTALTHYSTTEQLVGTWIDGKPLYQLTFTMKTPSAVGSVSYNLSAYNIDKIISEDAMLQRTTNDIDQAVNWHYANNDHDMCTYFNFDTGFYYIYKAKGTSDMNANAYITLKYTKK